MRPHPPKDTWSGFAPLAIGGAIGVAAGWIALGIWVTWVVSRGPDTPAGPPVPRELVTETRPAPSASESLSKQPTPPAMPKPGTPVPSGPPSTPLAGNLAVDIAAIDDRAGGRLHVSLVRPETGELFSYQGDEVVPAASLVKLCLLVSALQRVDARVWNLDAPFGPNGAPLRQVLSAMVSASDNESANLVIDEIGLEVLNQEMRSVMGFPEKAGLRRRMLDRDAQEQGLDNTITTDSMAQFLARLGRGVLLSPESTRYALTLMGEQERRNKIPEGLPADAGLRVFNKTGELADLESDAAIVLEPDGRWWVLVACVDQCVNLAQARQAIRDVSRAAWLSRADASQGATAPTDR